MTDQAITAVTDEDLPVEDKIGMRIASVGTDTYIACHQTLPEFAQIFHRAVGARGLPD